MSDNSIPLVDLAAQFQAIRAEVEPRVAEVMARGDFILGRAVGEFEKEFARYCECDRAVGLASGLDALSIGGPSAKYRKMVVTKLRQCV